MNLTLSFEVRVKVILGWPSICDLQRALQLIM